MAETSSTAVVVTKILRDVTEDADMQLSTPLQVDSLQALRILVELEKHFDIEIDENEIFDGWFDTGQRIAAYIERLLAQHPQPMTG